LKQIRLVSPEKCLWNLSTISLRWFVPLCAQDQRLSHSLTLSISHSLSKSGRVLLHGVCALDNVNPTSTSEDVVGSGATLSWNQNLPSDKLTYGFLNTVCRPFMLLDSGFDLASRLPLVSSPLPVRQYNENHSEKCGLLVRDLGLPVAASQE